MKKDLAAYSGKSRDEMNDEEKVEFMFLTAKQEAFGNVSVERWTTF